MFSRFLTSKMAASGARNVLKTLGQVNRVLLPQLENIRDSRLGKPLFLIYVDYKNVFLDFSRFVFRKPVRAFFNFSVLGAFAAVWMNNPDEESYKTQLMANANTLLLLSEKVRNPKSSKYIRRLIDLSSESRLANYNFGLFSLVLQQDYSDVSCFYEAKCYYFKPRWIYLYKDIVDVGFLGRWYFLEKAMVDYDVNEAELAMLPDD